MLERKKLLVVGEVVYLRMRKFFINLKRLIL